MFAWFDGNRFKQCTALARPQAARRVNDGAELVIG
jgi:hypothetical protein